MYTKEQMLDNINKTEEVYTKLFAEMKADLESGRNVELIKSLMPTLLKQRAGFNAFKEETWL